MKRYTIIALENFPEVKSNDNIAKLIIQSAQKTNVPIENGDIIVITQKIFSKAENRIVDLRKVAPHEKAESIAKTAKKDPRLVETILRETRNLVKVETGNIIVQNNQGIICLNAGIDKSNIKGEFNVALLPENPDQSAKRCQMEIQKMTGKQVGIIISDTYSRPFRRGQVNFAIGLAGIKPSNDYRGKTDLFGQELKVKNIAIADEIAAAAELLMGQGTEAIPVVIIKGLSNHINSASERNVKELLISREEDLFKGTL